MKLLFCFQITFIAFRPPRNDDDFSTRWRLIKSYFTRSCSEKYKSFKHSSRKNKNEQAIWQSVFGNIKIRDEQDFLRHIEYIHYNPVKHGYVKAACDWPYSSFNRYVKEGIYDENWGSIKEIINFDGDIGQE